MQTYVVLSKWTDQGIRAIKESPQRVDAIKKAFEAAGGKIVGVYLTMGRYDQIYICEAPSDEVMATLALSAGSEGNGHTETLKAFPEAEYRNIISKIP